MVVQYLSWLWKLLRGDMGMSFEWNRPVASLLGRADPDHAGLCRSAP